MRSVSVPAVLCVTLSAWMVSGCSHSSKPAAVVPPAAEAPTQPAGSATPQPLYTPPPEPAPAAPQAAAPAPAPAQTGTPPPEPPKPHRKKPKPSPATPVGAASTAAPAPAPTGATAAATGGQTAAAPAAEETPRRSAETSTVAAAGRAEGESPIGQLTAGDANNSPELRRGTVDLIASNDRRLKSIHRTLSADDQHTVALVKKFQQQARQALSGQDLHAANTLAVKAKLLLDELLK